MVAGKNHIKRKRIDLAKEYDVNATCSASSNGIPGETQRRRPQTKCELDSVVKSFWRIVLGA